jgi:hypothetical protein
MQQSEASIQLDEDELAMLPSLGAPTDPAILAGYQRSSVTLVLRKDRVPELPLSGQTAPVSHDGADSTLTFDGCPPDGKSDLFPHSDAMEEDNDCGNDTMPMNVSSVEPIVEDIEMRDGGDEVSCLFSQHLANSNTGCQDDTPNYLLSSNHDQHLENVTEVDQTLPHDMDDEDDQLDKEEHEECEDEKEKEKDEQTQPQDVDDKEDEDDEQMQPQDVDDEENEDDDKEGEPAKEKPIKPIGKAVQPSRMPLHSRRRKSPLPDIMWHSRRDSPPPSTMLRSRRRQTPPVSSGNQQRKRRRLPQSDSDSDSDEEHVDSMATGLAFQYNAIREPETCKGSVSFI